jgi:antitoxin ParD1/3/4
LGEHFEEFVRFRIKEGRYKNAIEVIRAGLRLLEAEEQKFYVLKSAIEEGIDSGIAVDFEPNKFLEQIKKEKMANYKLTRKAVQDLKQIWNYTFDNLHKAKEKEFDNVLLLLDDFNPVTDEQKRLLYGFYF